MPPRPRPQREAPCACGSGRPFAVCCARWEEAFHRLAARLVAFARAPEHREALADAASIFDATGAPAGGRAAAGREALPFVEWFLHDYELGAGRGTLLGVFADRARGLSWHEEQLLAGLLLAPLRAHQVSEAPAFRGLLLRDLLSGAEGRTGPLGLPGRFIASDLLVCRLVRTGASLRPGLSLLRLPGPSREELMAYLRTAYQVTRPSRHVSLDDFLDRSPHLYHHFFQSRGRGMGGVVLETAPRVAYAPGGVRYRAADTARIEAALSRQSELEPEPEAAEGEQRFAWLDLPRGIPRARLRLFPAGVEVRAETREGLEAAQRFVESLLRGLLVLPGDCLEPAPEPPVGLAGTPAGAHGADFFRRTIAAWPETPSILLQGRVPREVARTGAGRQEVAAALLELERNMARQRRLGRAWADLAPVREALDLPPPSPAITRRSIE